MIRGTVMLLTSLLLAACNVASTPTAEEFDSAPPSAPVMSDSAAARSWVAPKRAVAASGAADNEMMSVAREQLPQVAPESSAVPSMIIRNGDATIEVDSLEAAVEQVQSLARQLGGYIANTSMSTGQNQLRSAMLQIKIPAARWSGLMDGLDPIGKVENVSEQTQDVGEEFVDITARMTNARRLEKRLLALLETRTGKLEDVLGVERELARVREEIERHEGRLRYLRSRIATSTLNVTIHEPGPLVGTPGESVIGGAFGDAWRNFVHFAAWLISISGVLIPAVVIGLGVAYLARRLGLLPSR